MLFRIFTLVAVLALGVSTWILTSPLHRPLPTATTTAADLPGYYLKDTIMTDFDATGEPSMHLQAQRIDQVDHGTEVALSDVRIDYHTPNGQNWTLVGDFARVEPGGKIIDVSSNVHLQGESTEHAGTVIVRTDTLSYDVPESIATTQSDVRIEFGPQVITAHGLIANLKERTMRLESKVNGHFQR
jgi:LPS export ABC transporter protein LptC